MLNKTQQRTQQILDDFPHEMEFHQAVHEVMEDILPWVSEHTRYQIPGLIEHIIIPNRCLSFKVTWQDDQGRMQHNYGYRIQASNVLGPYKGGLRFSPHVNQGVLKFLAFEQTFKNSLTGLPLGAGKGGSDFNPKGKSQQEIKNFCIAFASQLSPFIGDKIDVPAGDIGVGGREIGYMYGQLRRLGFHGQGVLTGKSQYYGGSFIRPEATGYGTVYFTVHMLEQVKKQLAGNNVLISGAGNVALYAAEKCIEMGARVLTLSDSGGTLHAPDGIDETMLTRIMQARFKEYKRLQQLDIPNTRYHPGKKPWSFSGDIALPCATQNELDKEDAEALCRIGLVALAEGANMPCTAEAVKVLHQHNVLYGPGKAANAGGVAVSGLEMTQNSMGYPWSKHEVDVKLQSIMEHIHSLCVQYGQDAKGSINYAKGANIAGFKRVADALLDLGYV